MLNVLSFFFIFLKKYLCQFLKLSFDAQRFELFLYRWRRQFSSYLDFCFDAQRFELFLYFTLLPIEAMRLVKCFDAQRFELFLYYRLDFYDTILRCKKFRCSMFWAFSLCEEWVFYYSGDWVFRCSMFWAFSLWLLSILTTSRRSDRFDAQRFELFLYLLRQWEVLSLTTRGFDAQCFELFLYLFITRMEKTTYASFDAQFSELFLYFWKDWQTNYIATEFRCSTF